MRVLASFLAVIVACNGLPLIPIDLSNYGPSDIFKNFTTLTAGWTQIDVINTPENVAFFIVQIHTFAANVTLSSTLEMETQTFIRGSNVGLMGANNVNASFFVEANETYALIVVTTYGSSDPVPGGCNLSFETPVAPYQKVLYTDEVVIIQSQAPSVYGTACEKDNVQVEMYHLYLTENRYDESVYFDGLTSMLTVDEIQRNGRKISTVEGYFKYRKLYSNYPGVGHVFAIIATFNNHSSAYVPAVSYGCDLTNIEETCYGPVSPHWKLLCAILLIFGLFVCYFGHRFFRITLYLVGFTLGVFITYIILSLNINLSISEKTTTAMLIGLIYASGWLFFWWKWGIPILSISVTFAMAAYLIASVIFYAGLADLTPFQYGMNFWLTHLSIVIALFVIWTMFTLPSHIFACSFLGSYAGITALNYYTGGNLQYIIINSFRRIVVTNFNMATIDPPFQVLDVTQTVLWGVMAGFGCFYQWKAQRGKPPFPPPRSAAVQEGMNESTPLLSDSPPAYSVIG